jgi:hypothetical protein
MAVTDLADQPMRSLALVCASPRRSRSVQGNTWQLSLITRTDKRRELIATLREAFVSDTTLARQTTGDFLAERQNKLRLGTIESIQGAGLRLDRLGNLAEGVAEWSKEFSFRRPVCHGEDNVRERPV